MWRGSAHNFLWLSLGSNQCLDGRVYELCVYLMIGTLAGSTNFLIYVKILVFSITLNAKISISKGTFEMTLTFSQARWGTIFFPLIDQEWFTW